MVEVSICRSCEFEGSEANVVEGLVVDAERLVRVLHKLVNRQGRVVGLDDGVGNLNTKNSLHSLMGLLQKLCINLLIQSRCTCKEMHHNPAQVCAIFLQHCNVI